VGTLRTVGHNKTNLILLNKSDAVLHTLNPAARWCACRCLRIVTKDRTFKQIRLLYLVNCEQLIQPATEQAALRSPKAISGGVALGCCSENGASPQVKATISADIILTKRNVNAKSAKYVLCGESARPQYVLHDDSAKLPNHSSRRAI
jgi:hypothetical protein